MFDYRDVIEFFRDTFKYIVLIIVILIIAIYIITLEQVIGPSMNDNLYNGDVLLLNKVHYKISDVKRFDIISFNYAETKYLIKRVIGLPGEHIKYQDNKLYVNNKEVEEDFELNYQTEDFDLKDLNYQVIPKDMYLVLGDNRENSLDSRSFGLIKKEDIIGKCIIRIWPINKIKLVK